MNCSRVIAASLFLILCVGTARAVPDARSAVAYVNGEAITVQEIERELIRLHSRQTHDTSRSSFNLERLVDRLVNDKLLAQEARAIGLNEEPEISDQVSRYRDRLALENLQAALFPDTFSVSEEEVLAEYGRLYQRFALRLICVTDSSLSAQLADSIRHGVPMDHLAKTYSIDRYRDAGGYGGLWTLSSVPPDLQPLFENSLIGDLIGPAYAWRVFCLFQVENRLGPDSSFSVDSVRTDLTANLSLKKRTRARRDFAYQQMSSIPMWVDSVAVDSLLIRLSQGLPPGGRILARVGENRELDETSVRKSYMHQMVGTDERAAQSQLDKAIDEQVQRLLLQETAVRQGYGNAPAVSEQAKIYEDSMLVQSYLEQVVAAQVEITPEEVQSYYEGHKEQFRQPSLCKIATLTRESESEAIGSLRELQQGADFEWLARRHSTDDARENGGVRAETSSGSFPSPLRETLDTLRIGGLIGPVKTENGYMLVKLLDRREGKLLSLDDVSNRIQAQLRRVKQFDQIAATLKVLREAAEIQTKNDILRELQVTGTNR